MQEIKFPRSCEVCGLIVEFSSKSTSTYNLASASYDGTVKIWDSNEGECLLTLEEGLGYVHCLSVTKSGSYLASAGQDGLVYFWNVKTGSLVTSYEGPGRIMQASFNASDSKLLLTSFGTVTILGLSFSRAQTA